MLKYNFWRPEVVQGVRIFIQGCVECISESQQHLMGIPVSLLLWTAFPYPCHFHYLLWNSPWSSSTQRKKLANTTLQQILLKCVLDSLALLLVVSTLYGSLTCDLEMCTHTCIPVHPQYPHCDLQNSKQTNHCFTYLHIVSIKRCHFYLHAI